MYMPLPAVAKTDLQGLLAALAHAPPEDRLELNLSALQWDTLAGYLQPLTLVPGEVLFQKDLLDRTLFLIESGSVSVHLEDDKGRLRLAMVGAGSVVGEGAFFSHQPRSATVHANNACQLWALHPLRFVELANRQPALALTLSLALGSVLARHMRQRRRRVAST